MRKLTALIVVGTLIAGCAHGGPRRDGAKVTGGGTGSGGVNSRELEMGRQIHQAIVSSFRIYTEPRVVGYVNRIGHKITKTADRKDIPYQFTVLYDQRAYATEAPGGFVYLTTGFLNFLQNEAELAAVLSHEVARLQLRDPRFSIGRRVLGAAAQTGAVVGPLFGHIGLLAASAVVLLHAFAESRGDTPEERLKMADGKALLYLLQSGNDPQGYLDVLSRLLHPSPEWTPYFFDYLSSRPVTLERMQQVIEKFEDLPLNGKSFTVNRERYMEITKGVREIYQP